MARKPRPFWEGDGVTLYLGDCRDLAAHLPECDAIVTDPPYAETSLEWDVWPSGWPALCTSLARQLWCFGSLRMFLERRDDFGDWKLAQEIVWEKHNGSSLQNDRFRRVHELAVHFYRGEWQSLFKEPVIVPAQSRPGMLKRGAKPKHYGGIDGKEYSYGGTRLMRSVIPVASCHGHAVNETQKPEGIVAPLLQYSVPKGGLVVDLFAGSGTVLAEARNQGKRAIGIEKRREQCEAIVRRLRQRVLAL